MTAPSTRRDTRLHRNRAIVAVGLLTAAFGTLAVLVRIRWPPLLALDRSVVTEFNDVVSNNDTLRAVFAAITHLGDTATVLGLLVFGAGWLLARREPRQAAAMALTGFGSVLLYRVAKALFDRRRPDVDTPVYDASGFSFPSGHATGSFVVYGLLVLALGLTLRRVARRWLIVVVALVVFVIGVTRVALGVHYVTDVVGGWLLGAQWLTVTSRLMACASRRRGAAAPLPRP